MKTAKKAGRERETSRSEVKDLPARQTGAVKGGQATKVRIIVETEERQSQIVQKV